MKTALQTETRPSGDAKTTAARYVTPGVDIVETRDGYVLTAEMPGVGKHGLEVTLEGAQLTIVGHRPAEMPNGDLVFRESRPADYRRVFELDPSIDTSKISAQMEQGILTLHLPKAERVKPRRIEVTSS